MWAELRRVAAKVNARQRADESLKPDGLQAVAPIIMAAADEPSGLSPGDPVLPTPDFTRDEEVSPAPLRWVIARAGKSLSPTGSSLADNMRVATYIPDDLPEHLIPIAGGLPDNGSFTPGPPVSVPTTGVDPLDPTRLNRPAISFEEEFDVNTTLEIIARGDRNVEYLNRHPYDNYADPTTGAQLPPDGGSGYTTYDVILSGPGRGVQRVIVDNSTGQAYYTSNHYKSFYQILIIPAQNT